MKKRILVCSVVMLGLAGWLYAGEGRPPLKEHKDKMSYAIGVELGRLLKKQGNEVNLELVKEAIGDVLGGKPLLLTDEEIAQVRAEMEKNATEGKDKERTALAEKNRKEEEKFLAENKTKEGVVVLPSGLQYRILKPGDGKKPKEDDIILVHYRVTLLNGKEIESSYTKGQPESFDLENVVPGWREGATLMQTGAKWLLFVPSKLAYGENGVGELLGPNTMLIFELELIKIMEKPAVPAGDKEEAKTDDQTLPAQAAPPLQ